MKQKNNLTGLLCVLLVLITGFSVIAGCTDGDEVNEVIGTYDYSWSIMMLYKDDFPDGKGDGKMRHESIRLESDGKGEYTHSGESKARKITYRYYPYDKTIIITEKTLLGTNEYKGTFENGCLHFFDGDPNDNYTVEYYFVPHE